ncbi:hypothetical protein FISHEDRAFT_48635 [Fistulina hepatica ATCC 64428]|uniref:Exocyst complex component Sec8 n=1 Tax=Fistulina hepatica ATCC 64428 TaxID=1128425 RepID=A0A0D7A4R4_9AGAR|nr:hypothetical protein FISHEDRAFT_48635 [Fistulina hepatica ATCC 64428]
MPRRQGPSSASNYGNDYYEPMSAPSTRPLQIGRPSTGPSTPTSSSFQIPPNTAPIQPSRPERSQLRNRAPPDPFHDSTDSPTIDTSPILDTVKDDWDFIVDPDFNHVDLALQLLDEKSTLGKDINSFRRTKDMLSNALQGSVDKHYLAFAGALPHHASLLSHITAVQGHANETRSSLQEAKDALGSKRADLVQLWSRGQMLEEMMNLLDQIEHLKGVPDLLETLMSEKRLLQAAVLLVRSLKIINNPEMLDIGAVADLRIYLNSQEAALRDILVDELQNHLFLKSFWCESRWASYVPYQQTFSKVPFEDEMDQAVPSLMAVPLSPAFRQTRLTRFIQNLAIKPNDQPYDIATMSSRNPSQLHADAHLALNTQGMVNPEADSFSYMETLLESMAVLGKLGSTLDAVGQRLPTEIYALVDSTLVDVQERAEYGRRASTFTSNGGISTNATTLVSENGVPGSSSSALRLAALESSIKVIDHEILRDLFWTVYSKLDAVAQGLRVVYEVANRIGSRRDFKDSSGAKPGALFPLAEVWIPIQTEVQTLLYDYLTDEEQGTVSGRNPITSINEILRDGKYTRDNTRPVFRFADTNLKLTTRTLRSYEEELTRVLKDTVPGLVNASSETTVSTVMTAIGSDDRMLGAGQHHHLLIKPDAFHVSVLFQPTLAYLERITGILPSGRESARALSSVLDDYVLKVYLPQLEEKVSSLFLQAVTSPDAFQVDPTSLNLCSEPLIKAGTQLIALINSLCAMLRTTPFHQENYSRLILGVIIQFYQRCSDRFQDLVSIPTPGDDTVLALPSLVLSAQWAQRSEFSTCLSGLFSSTTASQQQQLCKQEVNLEMGFAEQQTITQTDLLRSTRGVSSLASLYRTLTWFIHELNELKTVSDDLMLLSPMIPNLDAPLSSALSPTVPFMPTAPLNDPLRLPLSKEMTMRFQALLKTYEQLAELILHTIRIEVHTMAIYYLESAVRRGNYMIDYEAGEPDIHVNALTVAFGEIDDYLSIALPKREQHFVFLGLGHLMEHVLISKARFLRRPTEFGIKKMLRNIMALRQGIKTIVDDPQNTEFERAKKYFNLFFMTPQDMLDSIRQKATFTFEEYQTMLSFQCGVDPLGGEGVKAQDRNFSMYVIDLHGLELERSS